MDDIQEALAIINAEKYDQGFSVKALADRIARIRAEARAEALQIAEKQSLEWFAYVSNDYDHDAPRWAHRLAEVQEAERATILAGEPKEERGAEVGDLVLIVDPAIGDWYPRRFQAYSAYDIRCIANGELKEVILMRRAEVERRIEEAGR